MSHPLPNALIAYSDILLILMEKKTKNLIILNI